MIKNNISFFLIFLFLTQCGYETIYSSKNIKFNVKEIKIENNLDIGRQIKNRLEIFSSDSPSYESYILEINSSCLIHPRGLTSKIYINRAIGKPMIILEI